MEYNENVESWQKDLIAKGHDLGARGADGKFGPITLKVSRKAAGIDVLPEPPEEPVQRFGRYTGASGANVRATREGGNVVDYIGRGETFVVLDEKLDEHKRLHIIQDGMEGYLYTNSGRYVEWVDEKPAPVIEVPELIKGVLDAAKYIATPIGGKNAIYLFGGQGHKLTTALVEKAYRTRPEYLSGGRYEVLKAIAAECERKNEWIYPIHYCWDCSGIWWYCANKAGIYGKRLDATAHGTYHNYCVSVKKNELRPGDLAFDTNSKGHITHMGIVGYDLKVYEGMSGYTGVVIGDNVDDRKAPYLYALKRSGQYSRSNWALYGRPKIFIQK